MSTKSDFLKAALAYAKRGWKVFPLDSKRPLAGTHGHKDATTDPKQIKAWWKDYPTANVGIACSSEHGPIVLDVDSGEAEELVASLDLPPTLIAVSGKKGRHLYFAPDGKAIRRKTKLKGVGLDLLGNGGYVVAPPSVHPETGRTYAWKNKRAPIPLPSEVRALVKPDREPTPAANEVGVISEGGRDETLTRIAGSMRRNGLSEDVIYEALLKVNAEACRPPLSERQVRKIARSIGSKPAGDAGEVAVLTGRLAAELESKRIEWLWYPYIPRGELTLLDGDPGVGKSTLWVELIRAILAGDGLPFGYISPPEPSSEQQRWLSEDPDRFMLPDSDARVLILSAEDDPGKVLRPKLDVARIKRSHLNRIKVLEGIVGNDGQVGGFNLEEPRHVAALDREIAAFKASIVIIDPLSSHLGGKSDTNQDAKVRSLIDPLAKIAQRNNCTVLAVRHLTKSARDKSIYRGQGNIAFSAGARSILLAGRNPNDPARRSFGLTHIKSNYDAHGPALGYELESVEVPQLGPDQHRARIRWTGVDENLTANQLLAPESDAKPRDKAKDFLKAFLANGPQDQKEIIAAAAERDISEATLKRAKKTLGVESQRAGVRGKDGTWRKGESRWLWYLP